MADPLISTADAAALLDDPSVRFVDCRWYLGEPEQGPSAYAAEHLPGAVYADLETHLSVREGPGRHPLPSPEVFAATMSRLGIGDGHLVIGYDDRGGAIAARLWWMLRWIGHDRVQVLDGGLTAWKADGYPVTGEVADRGEAVMSVRPPLTRQIDREALAARLGSIRVIDARSPERYRGEEEPIDPVAGHVPTAINRPYESTLDRDQRFLPPAELARFFGEVDENTVVYCGSGVTAGHDIVAMVRAGLPEPILYPGSWSDWSGSGMEVSTGEEG